MAFPQTIEQLKTQGYKFERHAPCNGPTCEAVIEWWSTPRGKKMPFDVASNGTVQPHWSSCKDSDYFRTR